VKRDSPTLWGADAGQSWDAVEAQLDTTVSGQASACCGEGEHAGTCCA
jgi:hypothetical protein